MRNYKQGEPRARRLERTESDVQINDQTTPNIRPVRTVPYEDVCPAYYPFPNQAHGHHLQGADPDCDMAVWGFNEQARYLQQEDRNADDSIKSKKR